MRARLRVIYEIDLMMLFYLCARFEANNGRQVFLECQSLAKNILDLVPAVNRVVNPLAVVL